MAHLQDRMAQARQYYERQHGKKLKNTEMAEFCKVSKASVGLWFNGPTKELDGSSLTLAAEFLGVNHKWLAGEIAPMIIRENEGEDGFNNIRSMEMKLNKIPVLDFVQAGIFNATNYDGIIPLSYTFTDYNGSNPEAIFSVVVTGKSMEPDFVAGDKLIIDAALSAKPGCFVIAQNGAHEATFKKFRVTGYDEFGREEFDLVPLNPDYPTLSSKDHDITIIGVMVRHMRDYKY